MGLKSIGGQRWLYRAHVTQGDLRGNPFIVASSIESHSWKTVKVNKLEPSSNFTKKCFWERVLKSCCRWSYLKTRCQVEPDSKDWVTNLHPPKTAWAHIQSPPPWHGISRQPDIRISKQNLEGLGSYQYRWKLSLKTVFHRMIWKRKSCKRSLFNSVFASWLYLETDSFQNSSADVLSVPKKLI